jgi:flagellar FliJ protein
MKRFAFRLERIRQLRERAERERAAALGLAVREERTRAESLANAEREFERTGESAAEASRAETLPAGTLGNFDLARDVASRRIEDATQALEGARQRVEEERARHGEARRDLRVLERLKEKRLDAWREHVAREEQKESDGMTLNRHTTKEDRS